MTSEPTLRPLSARQLDVLRRFAAFEAKIDEVHRTLAGVFSIRIEAVQGDGSRDLHHATVTCNFSIPEPGIVITRAHIEKALSEKREGRISERDLVHWATMLLHNDAYVLDPSDEDMIAEWLNNLSLTLDPS